jgi:C4-dicarboxylate transporter, DctM subunit
MEPLVGFGLFVAALLIFLATGMPVAVATGLLGVLGVFLFLPPQAISQLATVALSQSASFVLVIVPLYVLMGEVLAASGIGRDLFNAARSWFPRIPGSLAVGTVFASTSFAAVCGSSPVTAATIGSMAVPEMIRHGYDRRFAFGVTAAGGTLGILIPPSIPLILYGIITETSIGALFMAGIIPGLLMALMLSGVAVLIASRRGARPDGVAPASGQPRTARSVGPVLLLAVGVLGSIYLGIATPTEAGAVGAAGALLIAAFRRSLGPAMLGKVLGATVRTTAMFMLLIVAGMFASFVLARLGVPQGLAKLLVGLDVPPWLILACINLAVIVLGMFMDPMSILVIMVPALYPSVVALGFDPVWFGIVLTINIEIAAISPPVGFNLFVLKAAIPGSNLSEIIRGSLIFILPLAFGIVMLIAFPEIALFLPKLMSR